MAKLDTIKMLYKKQVPVNEFMFDQLTAYPLICYIHPSAIMELNKIAKSIKLQSKPKLKYKLIDDIVRPFGFKLLTSGTNRVVYKHLEDQRIVIKIAIDAVGLRDNPNEFHNQRLLKPFVTKCFEVSPCGTVGLFERVQPITSKYEFQSIAEDVFLLLTKLIGKYILEDIGSNFYLNYGLREGFGPVLLDFSYMYELDSRKLLCNNIDHKTGLCCGGEIDYDDGFNELRCTRCGKLYLATELQKDMDENNLVISSDPTLKGVSTMKVALVKTTVENGHVVDEETISSNESDIIETSTIVSKKDFKRAGLEVSAKKVPRPIPYNKRKARQKPTYIVEEPVVEACILNGSDKKGISSELASLLEEEADLKRYLSQNEDETPVTFNQEPVKKQDSYSSNSFNRDNKDKIRMDAYSMLSPRLPESDSQTDNRILDPVIVVEPEVKTVEKENYEDEAVKEY